MCLEARYYSATHESWELQCSGGMTVNNSYRYDLSSAGSSTGGGPLNAHNYSGKTL